MKLFEASTMTRNSSAQFRRKYYTIGLLLYTHTRLHVTMKQLLIAVLLMILMLPTFDLQCGSFCESWRWLTTIPSWPTHESYTAVVRLQSDWNNEEPGSLVMASYLSIQPIERLPWDGINCMDSCYAEECVRVGAWLCTMIGQFPSANQYGVYCQPFRCEMTFVTPKTGPHNTYGILRKTLAQAHRDYVWYELNKDRARAEMRICGCLDVERHL